MEQGKHSQTEISLEQKRKLLLTFKIKHNRDFSNELWKARRIAEFAIKTRSQSSADVKHLGLKSAIANQILRKYGRNKQCKRVRSVKLTVPGQSVKVDKQRKRLYIPCLRLELPYHFRSDFTKLNQVELDNTFAYVTVTIPEVEAISPEGFIGVDLNVTGHCVVSANPHSGKVLKLGKASQHIHTKYARIRKWLQKKRKYKKFQAIRGRERRIILDLCHKLSRKVVEWAKENRCGIKLENLKGIRDQVVTTRSFRYSLHSWSFYQLQRMIDYKAKLLGVPVTYIAPEYTSQQCSRCGRMGNREGKEFVCPFCGHVDHADVNAAFNIALRQTGDGQFSTDSDVLKGSTDTPQGAMVMNAANTRTP